MSSKHKRLYKSLHTALCLGGLLCCLPQLAFAQYSYDGNRWFEAEMVVFRHVAAIRSVTEAPTEAPEAAGFTNVRELAPAWQSYMLDFDTLMPRLAPAFTAEPEVPAPISFGPQLIRPVERGFRVADFNRDSFIALDRRHVEMTRDLQRLQDSPAYDVLWHAVWRQPVQGPAQSPAVLIQQQDELGRDILEGGLRLTDNVGRARADLRLWLSAEIMGSGAGTGKGWWLGEQRDLQPGDYYYFDNPAFGVLLQVRRYELPLLESGIPEEDF
jgi:hypothetical protein